MENLSITEGIRQNLLSATKWLKFLTIMGCIGTGLLLIAGGAVLILSHSYSDTFTGILSVLMTLLYIYPIVKSFELIKNIREAMDNASQMSLEASSANVKSLLRYFGILLIVFLSCYVLLFVYVMIMAALFPQQFGVL